MVLVSGRLAAERVLARPAGGHEAGQGPPPDRPGAGPRAEPRTCPRPTSAAGSSMPATVAPTTWPPCCCPAGSGATSMPCTGSPATPTRSSTTSPRPWTGPARRPPCAPGASASSPACGAPARTRCSRPCSTPSGPSIWTWPTSRSSSTRWPWTCTPTATGPTRTYGYMEGSAAVIGTMMALILESADPPAAREHARQLGLAFQLTNFIRDVAEDLAGPRDLPAADLERFGVPGPTWPPPRPPRPWPAAGLRGRAGRAHYRAAEPGIELLAPSSRRASGRLRAVRRHPRGGRAGRLPGPGRRVAVPRHRRLGWPAATSSPPAAARAERRVGVTTPAPDDPAGRPVLALAVACGRPVPAAGGGRAGHPGRSRGGHGAAPDRAPAGRELPGPRPPAGVYRYRPAATSGSTGSKSTGPTRPRRSG